jgi:endonuclease G
MSDLSKKGRSYLYTQSNILSMSRILLALILLVSLKSFSQDTVRLKHKEYTTVFSKSLRYPVLVEWWVTTEKVTCKSPIPRHDKFIPDPLLESHTDIAEDYVGSGFDRGHMAPAADNQCSGKDAMTESFYFSNMVPQYGQLNRGDWKTLEMNTRELVKQNDSIRIWTGSVGVQKKIGKVSVPVKCWKVLYIKKSNQWLAYIFENSTSKADGIDNNKVKLEDVEKLTGFKFKALK